MKKVLTIAGSDSGGGAGIQADLKTFAARGVYGMSAITALTAQNTIGVQGVYEIDANFVKQQIDSVMSDIGADAWKIGMLSNSEIIKVVADGVKHYKMKYLVLDPVMIAKSGDFLLHKEARDSLIAELLPLAYIVTPNHYEAEALTRMEIISVKDMQIAAMEIHKMGAKNVIVKGGSLSNSSDSIDVLYDGQKSIKFVSPRIKTKNIHGLGCTYSSAITAEISKENDVIKAIHIAKAYINITLRGAKKLNVGHGHGPPNHSLGEEIEVDLTTVKIE
ncbi:MAG: bifunctional hydroxymethylpyrimidine kinase/phosphomethylpyrimidine kinase [Promethearchaeota archaeon]|nr:MAG: bifunctional hydroxymethylpyrimidine kinase/phosphomethylpyrimidine kinase [Candidatus Lokiarchaeota archaeon]